MACEDHWERFIEGLRTGDEEIVTEFCSSYGTHLIRVADRHIAPRMRRRVGPESVVQSACCSFLRRVREGQFELDDSEGLWRLLCAMTLRKIREQVRFHGRLKRNIGLDSYGLEEGAAEVASPDRTPAEAVAIAEEFEHLLSSLGEEERCIVDHKLRESTNAEIAASLGCSERTVRRILSQLKARLEKTLEVA